MQTLSEIRATIKSVKADLDDIRKDIRGNSTKIVHKTITGIECDASLPYDFEENLKKMNTLYEEYIRLKNLLQDINSKTMIDFEGQPISLSNAIILSKELNNLMHDYDVLLVKKPSIERVNSMSANNESYYEKVLLRFNPVELSNMREKLRIRINNLDMLIDKANTEKISM